MDVSDRPPADLNPEYLNDVLAKSAEQSLDAARPDTLADHTWAVLSRLADQYRLRGLLAQTLSDPRLWHRLYWGCFFHDFGKAASGFQERLRKGKVVNAWAEGRHRHEVLSLAFVDAAFPRGHLDRLPIIAVVIAHHKDFVKEGAPENSISWKYGGGDRADQVHFLYSQLDDDVVDRLWRWFDEYGTSWARQLGFPPSVVEPISPPQRTIATESIQRCLADFNGYFVDREDLLVDLSTLVIDVHYRGLILTADHSASAGSPPFPNLQLTLNTVHKLFIDKGRTLNPHQRLAEQAGEGSAILIAPTGSGKTEAALLWAAQQMSLRPSPRLFYTLPYQASMNAMEARLKRDYFNGDSDLVTVQHSRATLKYYRDLMDLDGGAEDARSAIEQAKQRKNRARLNYYPVQVFSPYQMLKAAFQLRGYEPLLVDYTNALFIFDEIHAYDAERLSLIISMMGWLAKHLHARFFLMTATLPPMVIEALRAALPGCAMLSASDETFQASRRHEVHLVDGDLLEQLDRAGRDWKAGQSVLVCCNTVQRAQNAYLALKARYTEADVLLLHGRFNGKDRREKERLLESRVGVEIPFARRKPMIVVATQVVEVSLNIDFDVLYTDPAPLEALLQRFGRVNRGRKERGLCPVYVFKQPLGLKESRPYDHPIVARSLEVLENYCAGRAIDESLVTRMLEDIYQGEIEAAWRDRYNAKSQEINQILNTLVPYKSADRVLELGFYRLFDGVEVLPEDCYHDWEKRLDEADYLAASEYLVSVSWQQLMILKSKGLVCEREEDQFFHQVKVPYHSEFGLDLVGNLGSDNSI